MKKKNKVNKQIKPSKPSTRIISSLSDEANSAIKTTFIVIAFFGLAYLCIILLGKVGFFDAAYEKPATEEAEIAYDEAMVGTMFNRPEKLYYVVFDSFGDENLNMYFKYLINNYSGDTSIYKVDMSLGVNGKYASETGNPNAKTFKDLAIKSPTLVKIRNGKIVQYLENIDSIKKELGY